MQINPKLIKKQFKKSFSSYNQNAIVQKIMAEKLANGICSVEKDFDVILELGCGTGFLTKELIKNINFRTYYANDLVEKSKICIEEIVPDAKFFCGNALKIKSFNIKIQLISDI